LLLASLPSDSEGLKLITGPNLYFKKLKGFKTESIQNMHFSTRFPCPVTVCHYLKKLNMQTGSQREDRKIRHHLSTSFPKQYNGHSGIYVPNITNNYSEKRILIAFKIKMVLLFPSVNSYSQSQPASLSLLGEDKLTKKHVTNNAFSFCSCQ